MINAHTRRITHTRRVGLVLATPSDSSSISNGGHPVIPVKRQLSEDLRGTYPQKKVARPVALVITISLMPNEKLMILKDSGSRGHQAVSLKRKCSERFLDVHPPNKVARPAVITIPSDIRSKTNDYEGWRTSWSPPGPFEAQA